MLSDPLLKAKLTSSPLALSEGGWAPVKSPPLPANLPDQGRLEEWVTSGTLSELQVGLSLLLTWFRAQSHRYLGEVEVAPGLDPGGQQNSG